MRLNFIIFFFHLISYVYFVFLQESLRFCFEIFFFYCSNDKSKEINSSMRFYFSIYLYNPPQFSSPFHYHWIYFCNVYVNYVVFKSLYRVLPKFLRFCLSTKNSLIFWFVWNNVDIWFIASFDGLISIVAGFFCRSLKKLLVNKDSFLWMFRLYIFVSSRFNNM